MLVQQIKSYLCNAAFFKTPHKKKDLARGVMVALAMVLFWHTPASAMTFEEAAKIGDAKIAELDALKSFITKTGLKKLKQLPITNIKAQGNTLTGDVTFKKLKWNFIASTNGAINDTYIGFAAKKAFKFKKLFGNAKGMKLFDVMAFDDQMILVSAADVSLKSADLTANATAILSRFYENPKKFTFKITQGVSLFGALDMAKSKPLDDAMKFLGGKSSKLQVKGQLSPNVFDSLLEGKTPQPSLHLEAAMPTFRPKIGGIVQLPADVQFTYIADLTSDSTAIGFAGNTEFSIGKQKMNVVLSNTLKAVAGKPPTMAVKMTLFKGLPWEQAFGVKWLTIEDYQMAFKVNATGKMSIGLDGTTSFGEKAIGLGGSIQIQAASAGIPLPETLRFEINDGPNKVGALALRDMAAVFNAMSKAQGGKVKIPLDNIPDVAIAGTAKGEGPKIELSLKASGDTGIDMAGKLRILGEDIATIDKAFIQADQGIEIRAKTAKLKAGPLAFPNADIEVVLRVDRDTGTIPAPHVLFSSEGLSLFGSKSALKMALYPTNSTITSTQNFGELFKFNFASEAGVKGLNSFKDLEKADYRILASLQSDPGKWLADSGAKAVKKAFDGLTPGFDKAINDLNKAQKKVDSLSSEIAKQRAIVKKEKEPSINRLKKAESEVAKLQSTINGFNSQIGTFNRRIKSCNQTSRICVWGKPTGGGCRKKKYGVCYKWHKIKWKCQQYRNVPNVAARAACQARNTQPRAELAFAQTKKAGVVAAKVTASETVKALRKGIEALPVDLDPRVAGLIVAKGTAKLALEAAKQTVKGLGNFKDFLAKGVASIRDPNAFSLQKSIIQGSLKEGFNGRPVVLDMNFNLLGKPYHNRMGFSLTDWNFNAKQFEVIALGAATKTVIAEGRKAKIIPYTLLDAISELYLKRQAEVDAVLQKAMTANGQITTDTQVASLSIGKSIDLDNRVRRVKQEAQRNKYLALKERLRGIVDEKRKAQLATLLADGAHWIKTPGKAFDISAGANGSVWVVGTDNSPYAWTGSTWEKKGGKLVRIDVGPDGRPWGLSKDRKIWKWVNNTWKLMPGLAFDIGVGADGTVWVVGTNNSPYLWNGKIWTKKPGKLVRIDVGPDGKPWGTASDKTIWQWTGNTWKKLPGRATDIGVGANGTVIVVGTNRSPYVWDGKNWTRLSGSKLVAITVDKNGEPWGTTLPTTIYAYGDAKNAKKAQISNTKDMKAVKIMIKRAQNKANAQIKRMLKRAGIKKQIMR